MLSVLLIGLAVLLVVEVRVPEAEAARFLEYVR